MLKRWPVYLLPTLIATQIQAATLIGWAEMPADTSVPGPTSGQFIEAKNGIKPPFINEQPVQGFSALLAADQGNYWALTDNGFGAKSNSADYLLGWYLVQPHFRHTVSSSDNPGLYNPKGAIKAAQEDKNSAAAGNILVKKITRLSDPSGFLNFEITRKTDRQLTGADLDPESFRRTPDGNFWIGDEFFPALLQFNQQGELLAAPFTLPGLVSNDNPMGKTPTLRSSRGFEGLGQSKDGLWLYPMLEGALLDAPPGLNIYTFDVSNQRFINTDAGQFSYRYRLDEDSTAVGDFTMFSDSAGLTIERDSKQGDAAASKRVYKIDFSQLDDEGFLIKTLVADLLDISDPDDLNGDGATTFQFSFWTIEGLVVLDATTLALANDNNYPFDNTRSDTKPDSTEFILIEVSPLWE